MNIKKTVLKTSVVVLLFFGMVYVLLVFADRWGKLPYFIAGLGLVSVGVGLVLYADKLKNDVFKNKTPWRFYLAYLCGDLWVSFWRMQIST